ncbi:MAG: Fe-S cluster assembly protein HesB [Jatrophihabitantaceae bacterium]
MLTMTENATTEIRNIIEQPDSPAGSGLRIASDPVAGELTLSLVATPDAADKVLDEAGARVFLEPQAAVLLDDKLLDADVDGEGQVRFAVADQA